MIQGSCHCGAVRWTFEGQPDGATACNCTVVRGKAIEFHFCPVCGCVAFWRAQKKKQEGRRRIAVNLRLAEPEAVAGISIDHFDGLNTFEDLPRDGRCVSDYRF